MLSTYGRSLPPDLQSIVQNEIRGGEKLIWTEQPVPRFVVLSAIGPMIFAIPWTGFAVFWTWGAYHSMSKNGGPHGLEWLFPLWGTPFILIGLGMLTSPYWTRRSLQKTAYAITDQRAIVFKPGFFGSRKTRSFDPSLLASMERIERRDGSGDLIFERYTQRNGSSVNTVRNGFMSLRNVREVEDLLRKTLLRDRVRNT